MKVVVSILCWILVAFCAYFPCAYFHGEMDKKEIKVSHILVNTEEEAINLKAELKKKSFEELAEQYSLCDSKENKGDLGYNTKDRLIPDFSKSAFKLKLKQVSDPVKTVEGWHLIKVYDIAYFSDKENFQQKNIKFKM